MNSLRLTLFPSETINPCSGVVSDVINGKKKSAPCDGTGWLFEVNGMHKSVYCSDARCTNHHHGEVSQRRCEAIMDWNNANPNDKQSRVVV